MASRYAQLSDAEGNAQNLPQAEQGGQSVAGGPVGLATAGSSRYADLTSPEYTGRYGDYSGSGPIPMEGTLRQWYTGANLGGTENGWNTQFMVDAQNGYQAAYEQGSFYDYFSQADATGVVTWDDPDLKDSEGNELTFGSVVADGKRVGNVYEDFDTHTANLMMGDAMIGDGSVKDRLNGRGVAQFAVPTDAEAIEENWAAEISDRRRQNTELSQTAPRAMAIEEGTQERVEDMGAGTTFAVTATGVAGGSAIGAGLGSVVPVVGTGIGALIGGIVGGVSTFLNQDSLKYQVARNFEVAEKAGDEGFTQGATQLLKAHAQNVYSLGLSPLVNLVQGAADTSVLGGDGIGAGALGGSFYATNDEGRRLAGGGWQTLELVARAGDSLLTFASPFARAAYTAQMSANISAGVVQLLPNIGSWDERRAEMDNVWAGQDGKFDPVSALAGIGNVAVEAVQLGGMRGLLRSANREGARLLPQGARRDQLVRTRLPGEGRMDQVGLDVAQKSALRAGTADLETLAGYRFVIDKASGKLIGEHKRTLSMLAPSEALQSISAKAMARRDLALKARESGWGAQAVRSEDLYQAAANLTSGEKTMHVLLVNAFGEGSEEALQQMLQPLSHNAAMDPEEIVSSAAAGFASGLGMGGVAVRMRPSQADRMYAMGALATGQNTDGKLISREEWDALPELEKRRRVQQWFGMDRTVMEGVFKRREKAANSEVTSRVVGVAEAKDRLEKMADAQLQRGAKATDAALTITELDEAVFRPDARVTSHTQFIHSFEQRRVGISEMRVGVKRDLEQVQEELKAATAPDGDLEKRSATLQSHFDQMTKMLQWAGIFNGNLQRRVQKIEEARVAGDMSSLEAEIKALNAFVAKVYDRGFTEWTMKKGEPPTKLSEQDRLVMAKVMSTVPTRYPQDSSGSWSVFVPQVDVEYSVTLTNGVAGISETQLEAKRADFDGDKIVLLEQLMLDDAQYVAVRAGQNKLGADQKPEIGTPKGELTVTAQLGQAFQTRSKDPILARLGDATVQGIKDALRRRYLHQYKVVDAKTIDAVMKEVKVVAQNGGDVRAKLLELMSQEAGAALTGLSRTELTDEYVWMAHMVAAELQDFQKMYAATEPPPGEVRLPGINPTQLSSEHQQRRGKRAATKAADVLLMSSGSNLFRAFGKLHFTKRNSTEHMFEGYTSDDVEFAAAAAEYEKMHGNAVKTKLESVYAHDPILANVLRVLQQHVVADRSRLTHDMALLANSQAREVRYEQNPRTGDVELKATGRTVTFLQQQLYFALEQYRKENKDIWDTDPDVQAPYKKLMPLSQAPRQRKPGSSTANAELAFVETFSAVPMYELLQDASIVIGPQVTVGQYFREQVSLSPQLRRDAKNAVKVMGEYFISDEVTEEDLQIPYFYDDVQAGKMTAFRTVVDSVFSAASSEISITQDGELKGRLANAEQRVSDAFLKAHEQVRLLMATMGRQEEWTAQEVSDFADDNPEFGIALMRAIPNHVFGRVFKGQAKDGSARYAEWFFDVFAEPDATKAEAIFLRELIVDGWMTVVQNLDLESSVLTTTDKGVNYQRLNDRWQQLIFRLAANSKGSPLRMQEFLKELDGIESREEFLKWVNKQPGYTANGAPMLGWLSDASYVDPTKTGSGWTSGGGRAAQMQESFEALAESADKLVSGLQSKKQRTLDAAKYGEAIRRWEARRRWEKNRKAGKPKTSLTPPWTDKMDETYYNQYVEAWKLAGQRRIAYGPRAMLVNVTNAMHGVIGEQHEKASNPASMAANEVLSVRDSHFAFQVNFDRLFGDLTSYAEDDVAANASLITRDGGRMMDGEGRVVEWDADPIKTGLPLLEKPEHHELFNALMQAQVVELDSNNRASQQLLLGEDITHLLNGNEYKDLFVVGRRMTADEAFKFLAVVEAGVRRDGDPFVIQHKIYELAINRTSALGRPANHAELQQMAITAAIDYATFLQAAAMTQPEQRDRDLGGGVMETYTYDSAHEAYRKLRVTRRLAANAEILGLKDVGSFLTLEVMRDHLIARTIEKYDSEIREAQLTLVDAIANNDVQLQHELNQFIDSRGLQRDMRLQQLDRLLDLNIHQSIRDQYWFQVERPDGKSTQEFEAYQKTQGKLLIDYARRHEELLTSSSDAFEIVGRIRHYYSESMKTWREANPLTIPPEDLQTLSLAVISLELQQMVHAGIPENTAADYPPDPEKGLLNKQRYFEYDFSYMADVLSEDATDQVLASARRVAFTAGFVQSEVTESELIDIAQATIFKKGTLGRWTAAIPAQNIEAYNMLTGASAKPVVSMSGHLGRTHQAAILSTKRTFNPVEQDRFSTVQLDWEDLLEDLPKQRDGTPHPKQGKYHNVTVKHPTGAVQRPFIQLNNRFASKLEVTYVDAKGKKQTLDLLKDGNVAREFGGAVSNPEVPELGLREVHMDRVRRRLEQRILDGTIPRGSLAKMTIDMTFVHPDTQDTRTHLTDPGVVAKGKSHYNSLWHEGTVFASNGDWGHSLLAMFFFGPGGLNATVQRAAIDTRKKGLLGLERYVRPGRQKVIDMEKFAGTDFADMLLTKTAVMLETTLTGGKEIDDNFYNAVYKLMKLHHWVVGKTASGSWTKMSAEQVIEWQLANPGKDIFDENSGFPLREARLWIPPANVLASMMADKGFGGVDSRLIDTKGFTTDMTSYASYEGWSEEMEDKFHSGPAEVLTLTDTKVAKQARMATLTPRLGVNPKDLSKFQSAQERYHLNRKAALQRRQVEVGRTPWDPGKQHAHVQRFYDRALDKMDIDLAFQAPYEFLQMSRDDIFMRTKRDVSAYMTEEQANTDGMIASWIFQHVAMGSQHSSVITSTGLAAGVQKELVPGDVVVFDVSSYSQYPAAEARTKAQADLDMLESKGVTIMFVASKGRDALVAELTHYLRSVYRYQPYASNSMILVPEVMQGQRYANVDAATAALVTVKQVHVNRQRLTLLLREKQITENAMWVPMDTTRLNVIHTQFDLLPLDVSHRFNVPQTVDQFRKVQNSLEGLLSNKPALEALAQQSIGKKPDEKASAAKKAEYKKQYSAFMDQFQYMVERMEDRIKEGQSTLPLAGETFGTGDFIPLVDGDQMLLYRHGHKFPENYQKQLRDNKKHPAIGQYVLTYGEIEEGASTHRGTVVRTDPSNKFGMRLELDIKASALGKKIVYEYNGMKYVQTKLPKNLVIPSTALFGTTPIDGYASLSDAMGKEALGGVVASFQQAFTVFGIDFRQDIANFFGISRQEAVDLMRAIERYPGKTEVSEVWAMQNLQAGQSAMFDTFARLAGIFDAKGIERNRWAERMYEDTYEATVVRAMIQYLSTPGAQADDVLSTTGLNITDPTRPDALATVMPALFTRVFDMAPPGGAVKKELSKRINDKIEAKEVTTGPRAGKYEGWFLDVDSWRLTGTAADGTRTTGYLQMGEPHASSDNPKLNEQSAARKQHQGTSVFSAITSSVAIGAQAQTDPEKLKKLKRLADGPPIIPRGDGQLWDLITNVDISTMGPGTSWQNSMPAEVHHLNGSLKRYAQYRHLIPMDDENWKQEHKDEVRKLKTDIKTLLGLKDGQGMVIDYWVRQMMFRPAPSADQTEYVDQFWPPHVIDVLQNIIENINAGYLPTWGGGGPGQKSVGPAQMAEADLAMLHHAFKRTQKWSPWRKEGEKSTALQVDDDYGAWVSLAFGQAFNADVEIDPVTLLDQDGFMNTYRMMLRERGHMLNVSFDPEIQAALLDPDTNELISVTSSRDEKDRLLELVYLPAANMSFQDLSRGIQRARDPEARRRNDGWRLSERKRISRWRSKNKVRPVAVTSGRDFVTRGNAVLENEPNRHGVQRFVLAMRHGMAMLNPGLYMAALPEQGFRAQISQITNLLTGQSTTKGWGKVTGLEYKGRRFNAYDRQTIDRLSDLFEELGQNMEFASLIIADQMYKQPDEKMGKVVSAAEWLARAGNLWQDPTWGTSQKAMARRYVEAVLKMVESTPLSNSMTTDAVIAHLRANPRFFADSTTTGHKTIHDMAVNSVIGYRGLQQTLPALIAKAIYEPWATRGGPGKRFIGTILKMQLMYTTYNANVLMTMTGTQGFSQAASMLMNNRMTAGTLANRMWKTITNQPITKQDDKFYQLDSTLDGFTLANAFIKGGVTHTGLFMLGMFAANGLGLSGEDEEMRRRRRLAEAQNAPLMADPRRLEADFRNKDFLYLDWLPPSLSALFRVAEDDVQGPRAAVQINWLLKPFLNPIIGMERFFMTGDFNEITHAFGDAVGSLPLFNARTWNDAVNTVHELTALAAEQDELATPESTNNAAWLLMNAVGVLERQLFENMFVNSLYVGKDEWDRDPTQMILRDSDGDPQTTVSGEPRENDVALKTYIDPETGEVKEAYQERSSFWKNMAGYTENNATAAVVLSLFTGFQKDLMRSQMAVKIRDIDIPQIRADEARTVVAQLLNQAYANDGVNQRMMSLNEITADLKRQFLQNKNWDSYNNLDAIAASIYQDDNLNPIYEPLSMMDENGVEKLTTPGAIGVVKGIMEGTVDLDSPALRNIAIPPEMRQQIEAEMREDTIQEGLDMQLTRELAEDRWTRLWLGDFDHPEIVGLKDILWSDRIPWSSTASYKQLNTTYVTGPDGYPWATGVKRGGFPFLGGMSGLLLGFNKPTVGADPALKGDGRLNTVDAPRGINTGLRGLVPLHDSELVPTDWEQTQKIIDAIEDIDTGKNYTPFASNTNGGRGRFYRRYGSPGRRYGYGGGSSYSPSIFWSRQYTLPRGTNIYGDRIGNIFWDSPLIRRATTRRERYQSQRGRLNQWQ